MQTAADREDKSHLRIQQILTAGVLAALVVQGIDYLNFTVDDVFISIRYAANAAQGHGMVYDPGVWVEGYSNPLWVLLLRMTASLGVNGWPSMDLMWAARGLSTLFGLGTVGVLYLLTRRILGRDSDGNTAAAGTFAMIAVFFTTINTSFFIWSVGGLESSLNAFLFTLAVLLGHQTLEQAHSDLSAVRTAAGLGVTLALASLTRPEPALHSAAALIALFVLLPGSRRMRTVAAAALPFAVIMLLFLAWRWSMYRELLPNTFFAKTGGGVHDLFNGIKYLLGGMAHITGPLLLLLPLAFHRRVRARRTVLFISVFALSTALFVVYGGGDWMPGYRFFVPVIPILILLGVIGLHIVFDLLRKSGYIRAIPVLWTSLILLTAGFTVMFNGRNLVRGQFPTMETGFSQILSVDQVTGHSLPWKAQAGRWLHEHLPPDALLATGEAGIIGYINPRMRLLDCNGLMDADIARDKKAGRPFNVQYVLGRNPDAFVLMKTKGQKVKGTKGLVGSSDYTVALLGSREFGLRYVSSAAFGNLTIFVRRLDQDPLHTSDDETLAESAHRLTAN